MKFILGRKVGMTRVFDEDGRNFAVTRVAVLPCEISQIKNKEKDKYNSIQISAYKSGDDKKSAKGETSPIKGGKKIVKVVEFREESIKKYKVGEKIKSSQFKKDEIVTVEGTGKGKGFAGTIKKHGFHRGPVSHGSKNVRPPGSIGGGYPQRVVKGRKMPGHLGGNQVTVKNLKVIDVDDEYILISGAIPGAVKSIIKIWGKGEKAEEIVDHAAEEEKLAQEKMLEADAERKDAASTEGGAGAPAPQEDDQAVNEVPAEEVEEEKVEESATS